MNNYGILITMNGYVAIASRNCSYTIMCNWHAAKQLQTFKQVMQVTKYTYYHYLIICGIRLES